MDVNTDLFLDRVLAPWNDGDFGGLDEYFHPDFKFYAPDFPEAQNFDMLKEWVAMVRTAYPDFHVELTDKMASTDKFATQWHLNGTNDGMMWGQIPPTHQHVELSGTNIFHMVDDKIYEIWWFYDRLSLFQQLGLAPEMEMTPA